MMKKQNGITLIALVITIIVLLILAGVSIAMLTGDNGILTKASESKTATSRAEVMEKVNMELNGQMANVMAGSSFDKVTTIESNLGLTTENGKKINGYTIEVSIPEVTGDAKPTLTITIKDGSADSADFSPNAGKVSYKEPTGTGDTATPGMWEITPVKAVK